jgi:predicted transcriptional regulator
MEGAIMEEQAEYTRQGLDLQTKALLGELHRLFEQRHAIQKTMDARLQTVQKRIDEKIRELREVGK